MYIPSIYKKKNKKILQDASEMKVVDYESDTFQQVKLLRYLKKTGFHAVCYIGPMPRLEQIENCFLGIIHCISSFHNSLPKSRAYI